VFKGFGVLPQQAHKGKMSDICPACNFSTVYIPLRVLPANPENPQKEKAIKLQAIHLPYGSIFSFYITFKILNFCYATIF
jgi:hypothetical protein